MTALARPGAPAGSPTEASPGTSSKEPPRRARGKAILEFLLVGGATPLLLGASILLRARLGLDDATYLAGFLTYCAAFVVNDPHFTVTYLLFYEGFYARAFGGAFSGAQRARYLLAGVVAPALLLLWAGAALSLESAPLLGALVQLMLLLVGWHYVKQGFGVLTVLSARRGVRYSSGERIAILGHCYAGWAFAWANPRDPGRTLSEKGVIFSTFAHPSWLEPLCLGVLALFTVAMVAALVRKRLREGRLPILIPLTGLLCSVWPWMIFSSADPVLMYFIPALHSLQYLYFVWLMRHNQAKAMEGPPHFGRAAGVRLLSLALGAVGLGVLVFHLGPTLLDEALVPRGGLADPELGATPYFAALFVAVNLHHYFMDAVIWRRENPETRHLLTEGNSAEDSSAEER